jgi:hypothetical protein
MPAIGAERMGRRQQVANLGLVPASPSVADRLAFWRRVYETLAELASRIEADTQGKIKCGAFSHPDSHPHRAAGDVQRLR